MSTEKETDEEFQERFKRENVQLSEMSKGVINDILDDMSAIFKGQKEQIEELEVLKGRIEESEKEFQTLLADMRRALSGEVW